MRAPSRGRRRAVAAAVVTVLLAAGAAVAEEYGLGDRIWTRLPSDGVRGQVVSVDDTGLRDSPSEGGWIAVVPADRLADVVALAGVGSPGDARQLRHSGFAMGDTTEAALGAALAPVGYRGRFTLHASGPRVLCRVHAYAGERYARGCDQVTLPERGRIRVSLGEGGLAVGVR